MKYACHDMKQAIIPGADILHPQTWTQTGEEEKNQSVSVLCFGMADKEKIIKLAGN